MFHFRPEFRPVWSRARVPMPRPPHPTARGRIAWSSARAPMSYSGIWLANPDGSHVAQVIAFNLRHGGASEPTISPDGRKIALRLDSGGRDSFTQSIIVAHADGSGVDESWQRRYKGEDENRPDRLARPSWSPDGRFLAFDGHQGEMRGRYSNDFRPANDREIYVRDARAASGR
jgi:Tol biopolymer transport system component